MKETVPGLGRSPEEGNGDPLQCSCLRNPMDRRAWQATVHGIAKKLKLIWQLSNNTIVNSQLLRVLKE